LQPAAARQVRSQFVANGVIYLIADVLVALDDGRRPRPVSDEERAGLLGA